ncbi:hypothetical protein QOT17_006033 [Balamuthia mandrillaris]
MEGQNEIEPPLPPRQELRPITTAIVKNNERVKDETFIEKADFLFKRIRQWKVTLNRFVPLFTAIEKVEAKAAKYYAKVVATMESDPKREEREPGTGEVLKAINTLGDYAQKMTRHHDAIAQHIRESVLMNIEALHAKRAKKAKELKSRISAVKTELKRGRDLENMLSMMESHEKHCTMANSKGGRGAKTQKDPWLLEMKLRTLIATYLNHLNACRQEMMKVMEETERFDSTVMQDLQALINGFIQWIKQHHANSQKEFEKVADALAAINVESDFQEYLAQTGVTDHTIWTNMEIADNFNFPYKGAEVTSVHREGKLHRQGKIKKSNWKEAYFVLTDAAFLHCFDTKQDLGPTPEFSIDLKGARIEVPEEKLVKAKYVIAIHYGNKQSYVKKVKADTEEDMVSWVFFLKERANCVGTRFDVINSDVVAANSLTSSAFVDAPLTDGDEVNGHTSEGEEQEEY